MPFDQRMVEIRHEASRVTQRVSTLEPVIHERAIGCIFGRAAQVGRSEIRGGSGQSQGATGEEPRATVRGIEGHFEYGAARQCELWRETARAEGEQTRGQRERYE